MYVSYIHRVIGYGVVGLLPPYCSRDMSTSQQSTCSKSGAGYNQLLLSLLPHLYLNRTYLITDFRGSIVSSSIIRHSFGNWRHDTDSLRLKGGMNNQGISGHSSSTAELLHESKDE